MTSPATIWVGKVARRLLSLPSGRYVIVLEVTDSGAAWHVSKMGKREA